MASTIRPSLVAPLSERLGDLADSLRKSIVSVHDGRRGSGTGLVWATDTVITNHHVVQGDSATVVFADGREATGEVIGRDPHNDIVALRVSGASETASIGDSTSLRIGQVVLAVGHPMGIEHAVTMGIISGLPSAADQRAMIRSDLHLNPGNSGGPLIGVDGSVIGINAMVAGPGTALSVPEQTVRAFLARVTGEYPVLGLELTTVRIPASWLDDALEGAEAALLVAGVEDGSVAEAAGIYPGDVLLGIGELQVRHPLRLLEALTDVGGRGPITLRLMRAGESLELTIPEPTMV
ncbi:MAG: trypsin-like peptidase domain-containing protein [Nitrolancea sp.]